MITTEPYEFKYSPKTFPEMIVSDELKPQLEKALVELPNLLLYGPPGTGKSTFADILKKMPGVEMLKLNCSDETGIDAIRDKVKSYATSVSMNGIKYVYLNEVDYLSVNAQAMLRDLMEGVQSVTRFILCCNYIHKVIEELQDRCQVYELTNPPAAQVAMRCFHILDSEGVTYDKKTVINLVKTIWKRRPSVRKVLVTLKQNVIDGVLRDEIVVSHSEDTFKEVVAAMQTKNPLAVRTILKSHQIDYSGLYAYIFDLLFTSEDSVFAKDGSAIKILGNAARWDSTMAIKEVNFMTAYIEMTEQGVV